MNLFKNAYDYHDRSEHPTGTSIRLWAEVLVHHCRFHIADPASFPYLEACSVVFRGFPRGSNLRKSWVHVSLFLLSSFWYQYLIMFSRRLCILSTGKQ